MLTLDEAAKKLGRCRKTLERWIDQGVRGVRLRYECVGGRVMTRPEWLAEFTQALTEQREKRVAPEQTPRSIERRQQACAARMKERGLA